MKAFIILLLAIASPFLQGVEVKKVKVNDIELAYQVFGSGEPLIMVMGFRGTMSAWDPALIEALAKRYQVIVFDNRGAGLSSDTAKDQTTIEQMALDTSALIKALGYQKVHLLGWSMGSMIAMQIGIEHPELLKTLILCSPNPGGHYYVTHPSTRAFKKLITPDVSKEEVLTTIFPMTEKGRQAADAYVSRLSEAILNKHYPDDLNVSPQTIQRQMNTLVLWRQNNTTYEKLASMHVPTLVAGGLDDILDAPENVRRVACQIPFAWSVYFPGAGHAFLFQEHLKFSELIELFINSN